MTKYDELRLPATSVPYILSKCLQAWSECTALTAFPWPDILGEQIAVARDQPGPWCWEGLKAKGEWGSRGWHGYSITNSMDINLSKLWKVVEDRGAWRVAVRGVANSWTWLSNWITATVKSLRWFKVLFC